MANIEKLIYKNGISNPDENLFSFAFVQQQQITCF